MSEALSYLRGISTELGEQINRAEREASQATNEEDASWKYGIVEGLRRAQAWVDKRSTELM